MAMPNRNSSPIYRWATPFTRLRKENSFGEFVKGCINGYDIIKFKYAKGDKLNDFSKHDNSYYRKITRDGESLLDNCVWING
ncbi:hypothetical protein B5P41_28595 [Bacillus sp. SRB_28]|nr:hypothetical protein B5P41_28595 [Bacillus sp. SRB_28]